MTSATTVRSDAAEVSSRRSDLLWFAGALGTAAIVVAIRLLSLPRYLFWDDTQNGSYGQWYQLGRMLVDGSWTIIEPQAWQAGNYLAEGQWGLLNPLSMIFGLVAVLVPNGVIVATVVKLLVLVIMVGGVFALARQFGASAPWAALAAAAAPAAGFTLYLDAPSWTTGFTCAALLPWAWWSLRRVIDGAHPLVFFAASYLLISTGYVSGTIALVAVFVAELAMARGRAAISRVLSAGTIAALLTVFFYLPGVLTASVTSRSEAGIGNDLFLGLDLSDLATAGVAGALPSISGYWGDFSPSPLQYIAWFLPFAALLLAGTRRRERLTGLGPVLVFGALIVAIVIGPSVLGPLRYPIRFMPYVSLGVLVLFAVLATRAGAARFERRGLTAVLTIILAGWWFAWSQNPGSSLWASVSVVIQLAALGALVLLNRRRIAPAQRTRTIAIAALVVTVLTSLPQLAASPNSPTSNFRVPSSRDAIQSVLPEAEDGLIVVGDTLALQNEPEAWGEVLQANLWYVNGRISPSAYTVLPFTALGERLCQSVRGDTCPEAFRGLFRDVRGTGMPLADIMGINTVVVVRSAFESAPAAPEGWSFESREYTWLYQRASPVPVAGGIGASPDGTVLSDITVTSTGVSFTVDAVDADDPEVVLSRLPYPGYSVDGATFAEPREGFLLTVDLGDSVGRTVTVEFLPPGWTLEISAAVLAVLLALGWTVLSRVRRRRL